MINDYVLDKVFGKIKEIIHIEKLDNTKILIDTDHPLPRDITLKNILTLISDFISEFNL